MRGFVVVALVVALIAAIAGSGAPVATAANGGSANGAWTDSGDDPGSVTADGSAATEGVANESETGDEATNASLLDHADGALVAQTVFVSQHGTVESIVLEIGVDGDDYDAMASATDADDVAEALAEEFATDLQTEGVATEETQRDDGSYTLRVEVTSVTDPGEYGITAERADPDPDVVSFGTMLVFEDDLEDHPWFDHSSVAEFEYAVEMPGELMDTNADRTDDDLLIWDLAEGDRPDYLYAETGLGGDGIPGFGVVAALAALVVAGLVLVRRSG